MPKLDESQEALRNVEKVTESGPVNGEDLLSSPDLKRQLREAKERLASESSDKAAQVGGLTAPTDSFRIKDAGSG